MSASPRTKRRRRLDRPAIPLVLYGGPVARPSRSVVALAWGCVRPLVAVGLAVVLGGAALVGASFLEPAVGPAALVCAAAVPATAFWLDLDALEAFDRAAVALASGFRRWREPFA